MTSTVNNIILYSRNLLRVDYTHSHTQTHANTCNCEMMGVLT